MPPRPAATELLLAIAEPTRLRILNALGGSPLFVTDLQAVLRLPQPAISRHLRILREAGAVRDTPIAQYVLYRIRDGGDPDARLLTATLDTLLQDEALRGERQRAAERGRTHTRFRTGGTLPS